MKFRYIFVAAHGRSGSTLLNGVLSSIPGVCMRGENGNALYHLFNAIRAIGYTKYVQNEIERDISHPWHAHRDLNPAEFSAELIAQFTRLVLNPPSTAIAVGFKEIRFGPYDMTDADYEEYMEFLLDDFDRACVIFNVRKHDALLQSGFWPEIEEASLYIEETERRFRRSLNKYPEQTFLVDYDEYSKDPKSLDGLFQFLGAAFDRGKVEAVFEKKFSY